MMECYRPTGLLVSPIGVRIWGWSCDTLSASYGQIHSTDDYGTFAPLSGTWARFDAERRTTGLRSAARVLYGSTGGANTRLEVETAMSKTAICRVERTKKWKSFIGNMGCVHLHHSSLSAKKCLKRRQVRLLCVTTWGRRL